MKKLRKSEIFKFFCNFAFLIIPVYYSSFMNIISSKSKSVVRPVLIDALLLTAVCLVPALSHAVVFPLYKFNPMLLCLMAGMLLVKDKRNGFLLAVLLPLVSMLVTGMPVFAKFICMVPELLTVVALFVFLEKKMPVFLAMLFATVSGKLVFYALKALVIAPSTLIETGLLLQFSVILLFSALFALLRRVMK